MQNETIRIWSLLREQNQRFLKNSSPLVEKWVWKKRKQDMTLSKLGVLLILLKETWLRLNTCSKMLHFWDRSTLVVISQQSMLTILNILESSLSNLDLSSITLLLTVFQEKVRMKANFVEFWKEKTLRESCIAVVCDLFMFENFAMDLGTEKIVDDRNFFSPPKRLCDCFCTKVRKPQNFRNKVELKFCWICNSWVCQKIRKRKDQKKKENKKKHIKKEKKKYSSPSQILVHSGWLMKLTRFVPILTWREQYNKK